VHSPENHSAMTKYFRTNLAVVVVKNGESQDEAWLRYLADNPECAGVSVKIFHYPGPSPLKKRDSNLPQLRSISKVPQLLNRENIS
jgi:hypothetical protein